MDSPPGKRVVWRHGYGGDEDVQGNASPGGSRLSSRAPSRGPSRPSSPPTSARGSVADINESMLGGERPPNRRRHSKFNWQAARPRYNRMKSANAGAPVSEGGLPFSTIHRLAQRTQQNLRVWALRGSSSRRRTELDKIRELEKSEMLFYQLFTLTPMVLISASSLQAEDGEEKKVPVVLQQLSIKVTEESAKHYRNLVRIHLEYGAGLGLIKWEILRGYRDLLWLRTRLKARHKISSRSKRLKVPKLPLPTAFGHLVDDEYDDDDSVLEAQHNRGSSPAANGSIANAESSQAAQPASNGANSGGIGNGLVNGVSNLAGGLNGVTGGISGVTGGISGVFNRSEESSDSEDEEDARNTAAPAPSEDVDRNRLPASYFVEAYGDSTGPRNYAEAVEEWLNKVKHIYMLRADSNDLMQFLELSHMSLKLAFEYSFHGREGTLIVRSPASEMGWRVNHMRPHDIKDMIERHTKKWVLVRDSYIVIVDNIYSTRVREVFLVDSYFKLMHVELDKEASESLSSPDQIAEPLPDVTHAHKRKSAKSVFIHLKNNERTMKLATISERDLRRWQSSILQMSARTPWSKKHRFGSYAPVRKNVFGQWFVDARDYMWVLSEALENAADTIYILDWWLSPELYLRRPPEGNQRWRLDRVLQRKARQGVKIFVVVYRNVEAAIPIDSVWTKYSLLDLHENIHIMRSPNQFTNKTSLFWAHHEKLCVIDSTVAFNGGVDLCFGRWDTYQHVLTDDAPTSFLPADPTSQEWKSRKTQLFPGKDYSNARVKDFYELNKPFEDMYDRNNVPRMPWHDIHQMVVGQPARDLARHFVQRWNYVLRLKIPSRPTPLLLPPADFTQEDLERLQLTGTCEYQALRSSGEWSLGLKEHEQSIHNAYLKLIEESEHFVYIENQFFITSTEVDGVMIENQIGNALVQRIVRAHENGEAWKALILIPLMPGFEAEVDSDKAGSVRVICQCQFNSISRGPKSIFYRLESLGIRPDRYIHFFSLRKWGKFSDTADSPNGGRLVTELLYIHAKCMVVDDRIAVIGSANINERSMRGTRDSEVAVVVRDTKVVESQMAGKPFKAGKFAHSLRVRLMREHLGVDIDKLEIIERLMKALENSAKAYQESHRAKHRNAGDSSTNGNPGADHFAGDETAHREAQFHEQFPEWLYPELHSFNWYAGTNVNRGVRDHKKISRDSRIQANEEHHADVEGLGTDHYKEREAQSQSEQAHERSRAAAQEDITMENEARAIMDELLRDRRIKSRSEFMKLFYSRFTGQDITRPVKRASDLPMPHTDEEGLRAVNNENVPIDPWLFDDPLNEQFFNDKWLAVAERNTLIYRLVFRCQPDDEVETWKDYKMFQSHLERFYEKQDEDGGPNELRKTGQHMPERVDRYVLDGSIPRTNPDGLRINKAKVEQHHQKHMEMLHGLRSGQENRHPENEVKPHETGKMKSHEHMNGNAHPGNGVRPADSRLSGGDTNYHSTTAMNSAESSTAPSTAAPSEVNGKSGSDQQDGTVPFPDGRRYPDGTLGYVDANKKFHHHPDLSSLKHQFNEEYYKHALRSQLKKEGQYPHRSQGEDSTTPLDAGTEFEPNSKESMAHDINGLRPSLSSTSSRRRAMTISSGPTSQSKPARKWGHFDHVLDAQVAEDMLQGITGHLVIFPTEWLNRELDSGNWNFQLDRIAPLEIYD